MVCCFVFNKKFFLLSHVFWKMWLDSFSVCKSFPSNKLERKKCLPTLFLCRILWFHKLGKLHITVASLCTTRVPCGRQFCSRFLPGRLSCAFQRERIIHSTLTEQKLQRYWFSSGQIETKYIYVKVFWTFSDVSKKPLKVFFKKTRGFLDFLQTIFRRINL